MITEEEARDKVERLLAILVTQNRQPHMSGDPRERLSANQKRQVENAAESLMQEVIRPLIELLDDLNRAFDMSWEADIRAIRRWQEAHPGHDDVWPDRADMVVWLMEQLEGRA